ncbi:MAG: imidazoleglycerol-phosphate dehydratase [Candidatus Thorarchaeota archaeon]
MIRLSESSRTTKETQIAVKVDLDGTGISSIDLEPVFFRHMLEAISTHSLIDIDITARGDLSHHIVEDTAIVLGRCIRKAIDNGSYIRRFGYAIVPMDCARTLACLDLAKRPYSIIDLQLKGEHIEDMMSEDVQHFFASLAQSLEASIHLVSECGANDHHKVESACKAMALALREGIVQDLRRQGVPSSKGVL